MALISGRTILTSLSLFHITLGFFFLTNPLTVADQAIVYLLGESMGLPHSRSFETQSPPLSFLAVILALIGISDLVTLSLPDEISLLHYWGSQAPLRFLASFSLSLYTFFFSSSSPFYYEADSLLPASSAAGVGVGGIGGERSSFISHPSPPPPGAHHHLGGNYTPSSWGGDLLKNRVFFTFMFVETVSYFWVWVTLQEEKGEIMAKKARRRLSHSYSGYKS